jgi:bacterial leucyl aminopeptidase
VVLGGHMDSIVGRGGETALAPGADDNASGIAALTEVVRAALALNYRPARTVHFYGYAAEEVGLVGSAEIAVRARADNLNVVGVLQLDMTNFNSAPMPYIGLLTDYVDPTLSDFSVELIEQYVKIPYKRFECGYACSDHASWTENGFPATMPHEANMDESNKDIHTADDTLEVSDGSAAHSMHFVRFGLAFMAELAKGELMSMTDPLACDSAKPCAAGQSCVAGMCVAAAAPAAPAGPAGPAADADAGTANVPATTAVAAPLDAGVRSLPSAGEAANVSTGSVTNAVSMPVAGSSVPASVDSVVPASGCGVVGVGHTRGSSWLLGLVVLIALGRRRSTNVVSGRSVS